MSDFNINDLFKEENIPSSNWAVFNKVGDKYAGEVVDIFDKAADGDYPAQRVFGLQQEDGSVLNVPVKETNQYLMQRVKNVKLGDMIGFEFTKEIPPSKKGHHPAKSIQVYIKHMNKEQVF